MTILPGAVLGPGDTRATGDYIRSLVRRSMPARVMEDSVLTFVHVRDVAEAIARAAVRETCPGASATSWARSAWRSGS